MDTKIRVHRAPKTLITGNGCVAQIGVEAKKLHANRVLIITDPGVACCGTVESVETPLREAGMEVGAKRPDRTWRESNGTVISVTRPPCRILTFSVSSAATPSTMASGSDCGGECATIRKPASRPSMTVA